MAIRYVGDAIVTIRLHETRGNRTEYRGTIAAGGRTWVFRDLYAPAAGFGVGIAYDSPDAYDAMTRSAVSFGSYYTSDNRGQETPRWAPDADMADAIAQATAHALNDAGNELIVRRRRPSQGI